VNEEQKISLHLDNKPMKEVLTERELYSASESSFWLNMTGRKRLQALVYISNFSTRQIDVVVEAAGTPATTETVSTTVPTKTPGFEIALGVMSIVAAVFIVRRRLSNSCLKPKNSCNIKDASSLLGNEVPLPFFFIQEIFSF